MRSILAVVAVAAIAAFVFLPPAPAEAGPIWQATLASTDAGSSQTVALTKQRCYCVQPTYSQTCMKLGNTDGGSLLAGLYGADCSKDFMIPQQAAFTTQVVKATYCFESGSRNAVVVANVDAGPATTQLFVLESSNLCQTVTGF